MSRFVSVRGGANPPRLAMDKKQIYGGVDCLAFTNDLQVYRSVAIVVVDINAAGHDASEFFDVTNLRLELLVIA